MGPMKRLRKKKDFRKNGPSVSAKSERAAAESWLGKQIKTAAKQKSNSKLQLLIKAFKSLFPQQPLSPQIYLFEAYWEIKQYRKAIRIYQGMGCPFWYAEKVGAYYERRNQAELAMMEFERLE